MAQLQRANASFRQISLTESGKLHHLIYISFSKGGTWRAVKQLHSPRNLNQQSQNDRSEIAVVDVPRDKGGGNDLHNGLSAEEDSSFKVRYCDGGENRDRDRLEKGGVRGGRLYW